MMLLTKANKKALAPLYSTDGQGDEAVAVVKFFTPDSNWTWYATEYDGEDSFFGLVVGQVAELGYFSLAELQKIRGGLGLPVERDRYFKPTSIGALKAQHADRCLC